MEVVFQKNFRISGFDLILIGISAQDFSLKISLKSKETKNWNHSQCLLYEKLKYFHTDFLRYVIWVVKRKRNVLGTKQESKCLALNISK